MGNKSAVPKWDDEQKGVIQSPPGERMLVEAGPGTGKTAVACARVAWLINDQDVTPSNIWLFSFTRTAVKEIRDRIVDYIGDERKARAVRITTLDSRIWYLRQGFDREDVAKLLKGGYELNIERVTEMLKEGNEGLVEYLEDLEHLIVDEAQDLVGSRGELVCHLIKNLEPECGVTVFADSAQAIYGFTTDDLADDDTASFKTIPELKNGNWGEFTPVPLKTVYRTEDKQLSTAWEKLREHVLFFDGDPIDGYNEVRAAVSGLAHDTVPGVKEQELKDRTDVLVLYRTRAQVLHASAQLWDKGVAHKLRMSGIPQRLTPWIARIFWDFEGKTISADEFGTRWADRVAPEGLFNESDHEQGWEALRHYCGEGKSSVSMQKIRRRLSVDRPPVEFLLPEDKLPGPILGTIHASKGREAPDVRLMLTKDLRVRDEEDIDGISEEGRVVFVAATRAQTALKVGETTPIYSGSLEDSGRVFKAGNNPKWISARVEFGRSQDIDRTAHLEKDAWPDGPDHPIEVQEFLWQQSLSHVPVYAEKTAETDWKFWLHEGDGSKQGIDWLGCLSKSIENDFWSIANYVARKKGHEKLRPGNKSKFLHMIGSASVVLPEEDDLKHRLHKPWSLTGIYMVPVITGFTNVYFNKPRGSR